MGRPHIGPPPKTIPNTKENILTTGTPLLLGKTGTTPTQNHIWNTENFFTKKGGEVEMPIGQGNLQQTHTGHGTPPIVYIGSNKNLNHQKIETRGIVTTGPDEINSISTVGGTAPSHPGNPDQDLMKVGPLGRPIPPDIARTRKGPPRGLDPNQPPGVGTHIPQPTGTEGKAPTPH